MRWIRYILLPLGGLIVLCMLLITIALLTFDNDDYRRLVIRSVGFFTGYKVTIEDTFTLELSKEPSLSAETIRLDPGPNGSQPPITAIGKLRIKIALSPLLTGTLVVKELMVEDVAMSVRVGEASEPESRRVSAMKAPSDIDIPIMESVRLRNIRLDLVNEAENSTVPIMLRQFDIDDIKNAGPLFIKGEGTVSGNDFWIDGKLGALAAIFRGDQPYPAFLKLRSTGFNLTTSGTVEDLVDGEGLKFQLTGEAGELSNMLGLLQIDVPRLGHLNLEATVSGDISAPRVSNINVTLSGDPQVEIAVKGSIGNAMSGEGTNILVSGSCSNPDIIKMLLPENLPLISRISIAGNVREAKGALAIESLAVQAIGKNGLSVKADGRIGLGEVIKAPTVNDMEVRISLSLPTTEPLKPYVMDSLPEMGPLMARARLTGSLERLSLEDIVIDSGGSGPLQFTSQGRIGLLTAGDDTSVSEIDLTASLKAAKTGLLASGFGVEIPEMGSVSLRTRIRGSLNQFQLAEINAHTSSAKGLKVALSGSIHFEQQKKSGFLGNMNIQARIDAPSMGVATSPLGFTFLSDLKPFRASAQIVGTTEVLSLNKIVLNIGQSSPMRIQLKGDVDRVPLVGDRPISDIKLFASFDADNTSALSTDLGISIPNLGQMNGSFQLSGNLAQLGISKARLSTASSQGLEISAIGSVDRIHVEGEKPVEGVNALLTITAPGVGTLPGLADLELPDLGPLQVKANINDRSGSLDVETFDIRTGSKKEPTFRMQGKAHRITDLNQIALRADFETTSQMWVEKYIQESVKNNHTLAGAIEINGAADGLNVDEVWFGTADRKRLVMLAQGTVKDLSGSPAIDLQIDTTAPNPPAVGSILGLSLPPLGPLAIKGQIKGHAQGGIFEGETRIGETSFKATVSGDFAGQRPRIDAKFQSETVDLEAIGIYPEAFQESSAARPQPKSKKDAPLFDNTPLSFEALKNFDLSLTLDAKKLIGRNLKIEDLDLDILLENGRLRIHPANMVYAAGLSSFEFIIDASGSKPEFILKVKGEDIDIDDVLAYAHEPIILSGNLNLVVDLQSVGGSAREVASNLNGEFSIALENGRIQRIVNFLSPDAFDVLLTTARMKKYTDLHCLITKIQIEKGIGNVQIFFMDTPSIKAKGAGKVNLAEETIEFVVYPEAKKRLYKKSTALMISGPLSKPSVVKLPSAEAAQLYGEIFMPYVFVPARALGYLWYLVKKDQEGTPCMFEGP